MTSGREVPRGSRWLAARLAQRWRRALSESEPAALPLLLAVVVGVGLAGGFAGVQEVPVGVMLLPLLASGFILRLVAARVVVAATLLMLLFVIARQGAEQVRIANIAAIGIGTAMTLWLATARERIGVAGLRGEAMLLELRDTLREHGALPRLPGGWVAEVMLESAGGASFSGDFVVSSVTRDGRMLEVALVDVSGKGVAAGTRALLLSGAFGGLLGSVLPEKFLPAANRYVLGQAWDEGFATAVHLVVDLTSGEYWLRSAGHPPAVQFDAGSGRWRVAATEGLALGLVAGARWDVEPGQLRPGDALLLYTDGLVEIPGRDLAVGIDKLLGEAERLVPRGFAGGARRLLEAMRSTATDDRALLLLWHR